MRTVVKERERERQKTVGKFVWFLRLWMLLVYLDKVAAGHAKLTMAFWKFSWVDIGDHNLEELVFFGDDIVGLIGVRKNGHADVFRA